MKQVHVKIIYMLVTISPKMCINKFAGILKGKSSLMIFDQFANLKYKYGNRHFWCRGYYVGIFDLKSNYKFGLRSKYHFSAIRLKTSK